MDGSKADVVLNKSQSQTIAFCIIDAVETYCETHAEEFAKFLEAEQEKKGGAKNGQQQR